MEYGLSSDRLLERMLYKGIVLTETIKNNAFPSLSPMEKAVLEMESAAQNYKYAIFCTPYIRTKDDGTWFADIYLSYDENNLEPFGKKGKIESVVMRRLIIAPGYMMTEEDEYILTCLHGAVWIDYNERVTGNFVNELDKVAPELHMKKYAFLVEAFYHAYYASFKSGIREILYKCSLDEIAKHLDMISGYNMIASNVESAFGMPLKLLRKLNHFDAIEKVLCDEESRALATKIYKNKHTILNDVDRLNIYQIKYLQSVINGELQQDKTVLKTLGTLEEGWDSEVDEFVDGMELYKKYLEYVTLVNKLGKNCHFPKYVPLGLEDSERFYSAFDLLERCIIDEIPASQMKEMSRKWKQKYSYEDDKFKIVIPESLPELLDESNQQHNCLYQMIDDEILMGKSTVLFLRDKKAIKKSLVTIEIRNNAIIQAKRVCNNPITEEDKSFLKAFAKEKGLEFKAIDCIYTAYPDAPFFIERMPFGVRLDADERMNYMRIPDGIEDYGLPFA